MTIGAGEFVTGDPFHVERHPIGIEPSGQKTSLFAPSQQLVA